MVKTRLEMATVSAENERLAHTDQITGLASRRAFFVRLADLFAQQRDYVILTIDLDGFKLLNDHHGHIFGDDVLAEVGKRIANIVGEHNPARLG
jgi:diguanylate cyclase (GGDEF)-like protein